MGKKILGQTYLVPTPYLGCHYRDYEMINNNTLYLTSPYSYMSRTCHTKSIIINARGNPTGLRYLVRYYICTYSRSIQYT